MTWTSRGFEGHCLQWDDITVGATGDDAGPNAKTLVGVPQWAGT